MMFFYLGLIDSLDGDTIVIVVIGGDICKAELAVSEQFSDGVSIIEILSVPKIDVLTVRDPSSVSPLDLVVLCLLLVFITNLLFRLPLWLWFRYLRGRIRAPAIAAMFGGFRRREAETHVMLLELTFSGL